MVLLFTIESMKCNHLLLKKMKTHFRWQIESYNVFVFCMNETNRIFMLFFLEKNKNVLYILSIKCKGLRRSLTIQYENAIWKNNLP